MLKDRLMEIMDSDQSYPVASPATFLWGASKLYGGVMRLRRRLYEHKLLPSYKLSCPVVSVGNLALGGTGKTPMVIHLARMIRKLGLRVAILSRGYKGRAQKKGAVVTDGRFIRCGVDHSGDEPYLMASLLENVPVVVGKDRCAIGRNAIERFNPDILLLDDAFQHLRIRRDLDLLLLDARRPYGNTHLFPRGRLREPVTALSNADAVVMTRSSKDEGPSNVEHVQNHRQRGQLFRSRHVGVIRGKAPADRLLPPLEELGPLGSGLKNLRMFAFSGLANNPSFFNTVTEFGADLRGALPFDDHHNFGDATIKAITNAAVRGGAECLITTDKDYMRLIGKTRFPLELVVMGVEIDFMEDVSRWNAFVEERINRLVERRKVA